MSETQTASGQSTGLNLQKGNRLDLTKGTGLKVLRLGLGWDTNGGNGAPFDLDVISAVSFLGRKKKGVLNCTPTPYLLHIVRLRANSFCQLSHSPLPEVHIAP